MEIRVLQCVIGNMNQGGLENNLMSIYRNINKENIQFDFVTHSENNFYSEEIRQLGGKIYCVENKSRNFLRFIKQFSEILVAHPEYKIIHIHTSYALMYFDALISKYYNRKIIVHSHASSGNGLKQKIINSLLKNRLDSIADFKLAVSYNSANWLFSKSTIMNKQYILMNNSIDVNKFYFDLSIRDTMREKYNVENKYVLGITARLDRIKNIPFVIELLYKLNKISDDYMLFIIGDGNQRENIKNKIKQLDLQDHVVLLGFQNNINDFLNLFDTFVFPSFNEGLGISILEAAATGLPCLISDTLPSELNVTKNIVRLPIKDNDLDVWVDKVNKFRDNRNIRENYSELLVKNGYSVYDNAKKWEKFYMRVIENEID